MAAADLSLLSSVGAKPPLLCALWNFGLEVVASQAVLARSSLQSALLPAKYERGQVKAEVLSKSLNHWDSSVAVVEMKMPSDLWEVCPASLQNRKAVDKCNPNRPSMVKSSFLMVLMQGCASRCAKVSWLEECSIRRGKQARNQLACLCGLHLLLFEVSRYLKDESEEHGPAVTQNELPQVFYISSFPSVSCPCLRCSWLEKDKCLAVEGMKASHLPLIPVLFWVKMSVCVGMWHVRAEHSPAEAVYHVCSVIRSSQVILEAAFTFQPQRISSQRSRKRSSIWHVRKNTPCSGSRSCRAAPCECLWAAMYARSSSAGVLNAS